MYRNLVNLMSEKNVTYKQLAELLKCKYQTISGKIKGNTCSGLSYDEAIKIKKVFFPEYDIEYLFEKEVGKCLYQ